MAGGAVTPPTEAGHLVQSRAVLDATFRDRLVILQRQATIGQAQLRAKLVSNAVDRVGGHDIQHDGVADNRPRKDLHRGKAFHHGVNAQAGDTQRPLE
eukprot:CAMPEP_0117560706 /NCGR_PEP_ID=MMETSP0784-20121206/54013_1 /TAXON_ID=39447 /ORGANISM="" /LENGTH=97 /DNA_ID=CAMNT_0005358121 /DNA_START=407 /DNA_END=696 /DNA_ORIENTATION=-